MWPYYLTASMVQEVLVWGKVLCRQHSKSQQENYKLVPEGFKSGPHQLKWRILHFVKNYQTLAEPEYQNYVTKDHKARTAQHKLSSIKSTKS